MPQLNLSPSTIKRYVRSSYRKIGAKSRSQAVLWLAEHVPMKRNYASGSEALGGQAPDGPARPTVHGQS